MAHQRCEHGATIASITLWGRISASQSCSRAGQGYVTRERERRAIQVQRASRIER
jgi:hypothetical protein